MTVTTVVINCDVSLADDTEFTAARLDFALSGPDYDTASNDVIPAQTVSVTLDVDGLGTANLWPVDLGVNNTHYAVTVVGSFVQSGATKSASFSLGNIRPASTGGPFALADLLAQESGGIIVGSTVYATLADAVAAAVAAAAAATNAAAAAGAPIYPDTAAGIAGVADGAVFMVPIVGGGLSIYERDGVSAVLIGSFGETPDLATTTVAGLMSSTDKVKMDAINLTTISGALQASNNLSDLALAETARSNLQVAYASQSEAENAITYNRVTKPVNIKHYVDFIKATQAEAETGTDPDKLMTPLRSAQAIAALAPSPPSQLQATWNTGTDTTESTITPAKLSGAIAAIAPATVMTTIASASLGAVGAHGFFQGVTGNSGDTFAGASLVWSSRATESSAGNPAPTGTWMLLGKISVSDRASLFVRIS